MRMFGRGRLGVCVLGLAVIASANPYRTIGERNIFDLRPPPPVVSTPGDVFKPRADIKLTGIAAFGEHKWVLLTKADPGKAPRHFMLREGEQTDGVEIVDVNEIAAIAKIRSEGALLELKLATNAVPHVDLATQRFVNEHTRAHEAHQRREAARIARERSEVDRMQRVPRTREAPLHGLSPDAQAILESQ